MSKVNKYEYVLPVGYVLKGGASDYVIEKVLGKGGFGITYKVKGRILYQNIYVDVHFAVKEFFPDNCWREGDSATLLAPPTKKQEIYEGLQDFINEGHRLQQVCKLNPNIVNVNEVFEANGTAYYVLEYLEGGSLTQMVRKSAGGHLTEQQMIEVMTPVGRAVQCLHDNSMLHLDIKPDNIVMRNADGNDEPVLIDFGIAVHFGGDGTPTSKTPSLGVSPGFSPIEQYAQVQSFDPRFDVYAFSATCLYALTGKPPVEALNMPAGYVRSMLPENVSEQVASAIEHGMSKEKSQRTATIAELLASFAQGEMPQERVVAAGVPTKVSSPGVAPPLAPPVVPHKMPQTQVDEYVEDSYNGGGYVYDEPEGGGKKKVIWAIIGGLLGLALLAGIVLWAMKGCSSGSGSSSSESENSSIEKVSGNSSEYYDEIGGDSIAKNELQKPEEEKETDKDASKDQEDGSKDNKAAQEQQKSESQKNAKETAKKEQNKTQDFSNSDNEVFNFAKQMPSFKGGNVALAKYLNSHIRYPQSAQDNGVQGKVIVQFVVEKNGKVGDVKVAKGIDRDLDREAVRVCKTLPPFNPGRNEKGEPVRVWYTVPVTFKFNR